MQVRLKKEVYMCVILIEKGNCKGGDNKASLTLFSKVWLSENYISFC